MNGNYLEVDNVIKEISTETCFSFELAKHLYLKTGDKDFCIRLSCLLGRGLSVDHLDFIADAFAEQGKINDGFYEEGIK